MKPRRKTVAALLAALLSLGVVACEVDDSDPILDDGADDMEDTNGDG